MPPVRQGGNSPSPASPPQQEAAPAVTGNARAVPLREEARRALDLLLSPDGWHEVAALPGRFRTSGWFVGGDLDAIIDHVEALDAKGHRGVYVTLNPARGAVEGQAKDEHIACRRWLYIDIDAVRPKDRNASDEELLGAEDALYRVRDWLAERDWPEPVVVASGGGYALYYSLGAVPANDETRDVVRGATQAIAAACGAEVDLAVTNAARVVRVPGTANRRGPVEPGRPQRVCQVVSAPDGLRAVPWPLVVALADTVKPAPRPATPQPSGPRPGGLGYAEAALRNELEALRGAVQGDRNNQLNRSAYSLYQLVAGGALPEARVTADLEDAARGIGLGDAEIRATLRSAREAGMKTPRTPPERPRQRAPGQPRAAGGVDAGEQDEAPGGPARLDESIRDMSAEEIAALPKAAARAKRKVATVATLARAGAEVEWAWPGWLPLKVVSAMAAVGGMGKTRWVCDLARRIRYQLPWPDGQPMTLAPDTKVLFVVSDNHHDQLVTVARRFGIEDTLVFNAWDDGDPYEGTSLEGEDDLQALDERVEASGAAIVVVDTVGGATDKNLSRQEDARAFYLPLQVIARKRRCCVLCLTHLNATGQVLGRRARERVRTLLLLQKPDPNDERLALSVDKTFDKKPQALGVTVGEGGYEYDSDPPQAVEVTEPGMPGYAQKPPGRPAGPAVDWLRGRLAGGPARVSVLRDEAEKLAPKISTGALYNAKRSLNVEEYEGVGNKKWWRLPAGG